MRAHEMTIVGAVAVATGALLGGLLADPVLGADPPSVPVSVDEDVSLRLAGSARPRRVGLDTIRITTTEGREASGQVLLGRFVFDRDTQRRVVVRPEAVREYFQLVVGLDRDAAAKKARRLLRTVERSGRYKKLRAVDRELVTFFGPSYGAGTRLDDEGVSAHYPPPLAADDPLSPYRRRIAGDDALWQDHLDGVLSAFYELRADAEAERFFHPVEPESGVPAATSVLRMREHRRVLVQRHRRTALFLPDVPNLADLSDAGLEPGATYSLTVRRALPSPRVLLTGLGERVRVRGARATLEVRSGPTDVLAGADSRVGPTLQAMRPRIVNVTPPNGETGVDPTTDWEHPDNMYEVLLAERRPFVVRLRFDQPLDPRTVGPTTVRLSKVASGVGSGQETPVVNEPVAVTVILSQSRLGEVRVDAVPEQRLDPACRYQVVVRGVLRSLSGEMLQVDHQTVFETF